MSTKKRKKKRKPGIAHVGNIRFHIEFILFYTVVLDFLFVFDLVYMGQSEQDIKQG